MIQNPGAIYPTDGWQHISQCFPMRYVLYGALYGENAQRSRSRSFVTFQCESVFERLRNSIYEFLLPQRGPIILFNNPQRGAGVSQRLLRMHFQFVRLNKQVCVGLPVMNFRPFPLKRNFRHMSTTDNGPHGYEWGQAIAICLVQIPHIGIEGITCTTKTGSQLCPF